MLSSLVHKHKHRILTTDEVVKVLGIQPPSVYALIKKGLIVPDPSVEVRPRRFAVRVLDLGIYLITYMTMYKEGNRTRNYADKYDRLITLLKTTSSVESKDTELTPGSESGSDAEVEQTPTKTQLRQLGKDVPIPDGPDPSTLEKIPLPDEGMFDESLVTLDVDSFTSLCPVTGQPDHGRLTITYEPCGSLIETKSLKLYLQSYRNTQIFVEIAMEQIVRHLMSVFGGYIRLDAEFGPRGGIGMKFHVSQGQRTSEE